MRYKILLTGKNQAILDDFFYSLSEDFECQSTSLRSEDILSHINYFVPDAFVYCITEESKENLMKLVTALHQINRKKIKLVLLGDKEDCDNFMRLEHDMVSLTLLKPISATTIRTQLLRFLNQEAQRMQEEKEQQEALEQERLKRQEMSRTAQEEQKLEEKIRQMQQEKENREKEREKERERERLSQNISGTKHILIIDDDPRMLRLIKEQLREKYNVATAVSGKIALNFLERKKTDLILLDYEMPEENGVEVLRKLRANEQTKDIPVVFLTGMNDREMIQKILAMKPQGYLLKPIEISKLFQTIRQIIG